MRVQLQLSTFALVASASLFLGGCRSAPEYRRAADRVAETIIESAQVEALGKSEPLEIESPADTLRRRLLTDQVLAVSAPASFGVSALEPLERWPKSEDYLERRGGELGRVSGPLRLTLVDALKVAAANSREFQTQKEAVFLTALDLDLEDDAFRDTFEGLVSGEITSDLQSVTDPSGETDDFSGGRISGSASWSRLLKNGVSVTSLIGIDLVRLLSPTEDSARGLFADASITVPLMRGAGEAIVAEPLTQAQRDVIYSIHDFERFKRSFAVGIASDYLAVLQQLDQVDNAEDAYRRSIVTSRRVRRLADAGRENEVAVGQAVQDELSARERWISSQQSYLSQLDRFKITLGLPVDAKVELERSELDGLYSGSPLLRRIFEEDIAAATARAEDPVPADAPVVLQPPDRSNVGRYEISEERAVELAFANRLDLRNAKGEVFDAQRDIYVAADLLRAELTFNGSAAAGARRSIGSTENSDIDFSEGNYGAILTLDLPWERTLERNLYRRSFITLERSVRELQSLEDSIKFDLRENLRTLLQSRESLRIQNLAKLLAERRVESTTLFFEAGRAEIRDLLEAQNALTSAQNALTSALVGYRVAELELQRDLGVLQVTGKGLWTEYELKEGDDDES